MDAQEEEEEVVLLEEGEGAEMAQGKSVKRQIANSNERRRMETVNAGFAELRDLLPNQDCRKLTKAGILRGAMDYIGQLLEEKNKLWSDNYHLKRLMAENSGDTSRVGGVGSSYSSPQSPAEVPSVGKRRKTMDGVLECAEESDSMSSGHWVLSHVARVRAEMMKLRRETMEMGVELEKERRLRVTLEELIVIQQQQQQQIFSDPDLDRMQSEEIETFQVDEKTQIVRQTPRNKLEIIVDAIRHLEGDFSDDRNQSPPSSISASSRSMEVIVESPNSSQTIEVPLSLTASLSSASQALPMGNTYIVAAGSSTPGMSLQQHIMVVPPFHE